MSLRWPGTLAGQLALLVAAALFVAQAINFGLLYGERRERTLNSVSGPVVARIVDAAERLAEAPDRPIRSRHVRLTEASALPPGSERDGRLEARIAKGLAAAGLADAEVRVASVRPGDLPRLGRSAWRRFGEGGGELLLVSARLGPDVWVTLPAPHPRRGAPLLGWLLLQTAILYAAVLLPVLWLGQRAARSLDRLTAAAAAFGRDEDRALPEPEGPADIRRLALAFAAMRGRIRAMLAEKDRMLGAIGHDLRTPLASLRVRAEAVEDVEERARMVETIEEMGQTLEDILALARLRQSAEERRPVDLAALVDAVAEDFREIGAEVVVEPSARLTVSLRPGLTRRAIRNLVENAVLYGSRARLRVRSEAGRAVVEIDDDGPGIPEDRLAEVFEDFSRLETSRSRETGGSGLGLALAREIARLQGGEVTLANRPGGGLRATLILPVEGPAADDRPRSGPVSRS